MNRVVARERVPTQSYFDFDLIDGTALLEESYALRYQVYCLERNFLAARDYPAAREQDRFDDHSVHAGAVDRAGELVGTLRLIRASPARFPLLDHCAFYDDYQDLGRPGNPVLNNYAEISRLAVSKNYRRRAGDGLYGLACGDGGNTPHTSDPRFVRRGRPEIVIGLYKSMYQASKRLGITHWLAAMERSLAIVLSRYSFVFTPIGPEIDYYGPVRPYLADIAALEERVYRRKPELFAEFMAGLEPHLLPPMARSGPTDD